MRLHSHSNTLGLALVLLSGGVVGAAHAQAVTWDGDAGDGFWVSQQNWDPDGVPGSTSQVTIPSDASEVVIILSSEACATLNCLSSLRLTSATLETTGTSTVNNMIFDGGGFLPTVISGGEFIISGNSTCNNGGSGGAGVFHNAGDFDVFTFDIDGINGASGKNTGNWNATIGGGYLSLNNGSVFENEGTMTIPELYAIDGQAGVFFNAGTLARAGGSGTSTVTTGFTQTAGIVSASGQGGNLLFSGDRWQIVGGGIQVSNSGRVSLSGSNLTGTRTLGVGSISGDGTVEVFPNNDVIDWVNSTTTNVLTGGLHLFSGTLNIEGAVTNNGLIEGRGATFSGFGSFTNSASGTLRIPSSNGLGLNMNTTNTGTVDVMGDLFVNNAAVLTHSGGTIKLRAKAVLIR